MFTYNSPKHFVVSHVLHRLLVPRHPPCALINLTLFWSVDLKLIKSQRFGLFLVTIYNSISWIVEFDIDIQFTMDNLLNLSIQWSLAGSNRWPPACKAGALPAELRPHNQEFDSCLGLSLNPSKLNKVECSRLCIYSLERRWSSRTFRYGYLVTTSPQSSVLP